MSLNTSNGGTGTEVDVSFPANGILAMAVGRVPVTLIYHPSPRSFFVLATLQ